MDELRLFYLLKEKVLLKYKKLHPFFQGNWKSFGSQDIQNLIDDIEKATKKTISEKWVYTHLKPSENKKLPRKDMLDILSEFVGFSGWDEFVFKHKKEMEQTKTQEKPKKRILWPIILLAAVIFGGLYFFVFQQKEYEKIMLDIKNEFTKEGIDTNEVEVFKLENGKKQRLPIKDSQVEIEPTSDTTNIVVESPFYEDTEINLIEAEGEQEVLIKPDDYAMMLKAFMKSDIKNWETRKRQLDQILSDELEVIVMLKNNLGAEYFNKEEFSQKLIIPTETVRNMKIVDMQNDEEERIRFIRIKQE